MADGDKLRIFISWSGDLAKEVTKELHSWLPKMFDRVDPWMSDIDIEAGSRGLEDIALELDATFFGIIVVTQANQNAPWLNFEAGALSKRFAGSKIRVAPLLVDMTSPAQVTSPINQFQANVLDLEGVTKLLKAIATAVDADWNTIKQRLEWSWADFSRAVEEAKARGNRRAVDTPRRDSNEMIEELLTVTRTMAREIHDLRLTDRGSDMTFQFKQFARGILETSDTGATDDDEYMESFTNSREYARTISRARQAMADSWELNNVRKFRTVRQLASAIERDGLHPVDVANLAELYGMGQRPLSERTLRHVMLRHIAVANAMAIEDDRLRTEDEERRRYEDETEMMKQAGLPVDGR